MSGRIAFLGSPDFAVASLQALLDLGTEVALVISLLFIGSLASLIVSLGAFIRELHLSLMALKMELGYQQSMD